MHNISKSTPTCFVVYTTSSGNILLCVLKLQIDNMKTFIYVIAIKSQKYEIKTPKHTAHCLQFLICFFFSQNTEHCCVSGGCVYS